MNCSIGRRDFLKASGLAWLGLATAEQLPVRPAELEGGRLLGTLELGDSGRGGPPPFGRILGSGLDSRLFNDLSTLTDDTLITPNDRFFVRTASPATLDRSRPWTIQLGGLVRAPRALALEELKDLVRPTGAHLLECAGNSESTNFGLMSVAAWDGVPIATLLDRVSPKSYLGRILVSGVDDVTHPSRTSVPGASWIFSHDDLERAGAFLAVRMNGLPLPPDHGFPVRLVVPGWYGCACIKWVDRVDLVADEAPATTQMIEFAQRTHQDGEPALAREFTPAIVDTAAMPIRVEKWSVKGEIVYRVVGVVWGGSKPTNALQIRFKSSEPWVRVGECPMPATALTWSLWSHLWRPKAPGRYQIVLSVSDAAIRTRRLDIFFYTREVQIDEV